ncbi:MAG: hypothetical protein JRH01_21440 [Deltaproteobacteria bacterium]|nr:hypothetical protein [Deltaproteobacteria bacterium]MBW2396053.1 hypothetical protein [Deltaproteobacteria bacterium]
MRFGRGSAVSPSTGDGAGFTRPTTCRAERGAGEIVAANRFWFGGADAEGLELWGDATASCGYAISPRGLGSASGAGAAATKRFDASRSGSASSREGWAGSGDGFQPTA